MATRCVINFDANPRKICKPGETISGTVEVTVTRKIEIKKIRLTLEGFAECGGWAEAEFRWDLSESSTKCHSFRRYLHLITNLVEDEAVLQPGKYVYNFSQVLPSMLPFSVKRQYGEVTYTAKVSICCDYEPDMNFDCNFTVQALVPLSVAPPFDAPCKAKAVYESSYIPFLSTTNIIEATLPKTNYIRGDKIEIDVKLTRNSNSNGKVYFKIMLIEVAEFDSGLLDRIPNKKVETEVSNRTSDKTIDKMNELFSFDFLIPKEMTPSSHKTTKILILTHYLKIKLKIFSGDPVILTLPVFIGTDPYSDAPVVNLTPTPRRQLEALSPPSRLPLPSTIGQPARISPGPSLQNLAPTAPPPSDIDDLPPSFDEVMKMRDTSHIRKPQPSNEP